MKNNTHSLYLSFFLSLVLLISGCSSEEGQDSNQYSHSMEISESPIEISWNVLSNYEEDNKLRASFTFQNTGSEVFPAEGWTLYLNSIREFEPESLLPEFEATHISGNFFKLEPTNSFEPIQPGESRTIEYLANYHAIKITDKPQGLYFVFEDHIETVGDVDVEPFTTEEQINRNAADRLEVPTAESRYRENESLTELSGEDVGKITPMPVSADFGNGVYELKEGIAITYAEEFAPEAEFLSRVLKEQFDIENSTEPLGGDWNGNGILINVDLENSENSEAYKLSITQEAIELTAPENAGIFYAVQSLRALISNRDSENLELSTVQIEDYPAFEYRGMHLDVARNFQQKESVTRLLDIMGLYKLNKFHFHLTDDEGWRLAIEGLPELTEVGGRRGHTETEEHFLYPAYGSGPDPTPENSFGSGWFSRDKYIEILRFADERHIEVIPEIDVPGHARAAIKAMEVRYNRLQEFGQTAESEMYRLVDPDDESEYMSVQSYDDNVINVCRESTYRFFEHIFDEIVAMHEEAGAPLNMIHVGGDEVPHGAWEKSPLCEQYMADHSIDDIHELTKHFFGRLESLLSERGIKMAAWEEVAIVEEDEEIQPYPEFTDSLVPYVWSSIWGSGSVDYAYKLANAGYDVVMSNASNLYFDMAYNKSWQEPGFYWASLFNTKDTYGFIPFDLYKNADHDNYGNPIDPGTYDDSIELTEIGQEHILGLQGQLWSETVNVPHRWEYMIMPRLLGLAERAWVGNPSWGNVENRNQIHAQRDQAWNEFANRLGQFEFDRLDRIFGDLNYRLPVPGAVIENGVLIVNNAYPGLEIRYEMNGEQPDQTSPVYTEPVEAGENSTITLSTFNSNGRSSRTVTIHTEKSD